ncbi:MAG: YitT family protein [Lachnospiraceae bacterium]|nr:YitT family protein [Lachnospiraceae bacterium]
MSRKELAKRYLLFIVSLFFAAMGVAITKRGELGVSPISSVANLVSCRYSGLSLGMWLILWNCVLILGQILILRKDFNKIQLLQIPLSFVFGYFTDFGMWCVSFIPVTGYAVRLLLVVCGVVVLGFGIALSVIANVIMNSGEAFVKAVSDQTKQNFGNIKIAFDIFCVILSVVLSLFFFSGQIIGTREGTVISALLTGVAVKFFVKYTKGPVDKMMETNIRKSALPAGKD